MLKLLSLPFIASVHKQLFLIFQITSWIKHLHSEAFKSERKYRKDLSMPPSVYLNFRLFFGITEPFILEITSEQDFNTSFYATPPPPLVCQFNSPVLRLSCWFEKEPKRKRRKRKSESEAKRKIGSNDGAADSSRRDSIPFNFISDFCAFFFIFFLPSPEFVCAFICSIVCEKLQHYYTHIVFRRHKLNW